MSTQQPAAPREALLSFVDTLPRELLQTNAAPLLNILEELRNSYREQHKWVTAVAHVNVEDPQAVSTLRFELEDYLQTRFFDKERTHCSNIYRIVSTLNRPSASSTHREQFQQLQDLIWPLTNAENPYLVGIEKIVERADEAIHEIEAAPSVRDAEEAQRRFKVDMETATDRLRDTLKRLNNLANDLIDLM
jgi:hypothetical protein